MPQDRIDLKNTQLTLRRMERRKNKPRYFLFG